MTFFTLHVAQQNVQWNHASTVKVAAKPDFSEKSVVKSPEPYFSHIASLSTHRCSKCFCCYCFRWNIQFEHCWLKFIFWSVGLLLCGPVLQSHLKVHKFFFLETKQISKISSAKINSTNSDAFHASDLLLRLTLHWMCITLLCSWFEAKYDLISKHFLGRHCVHGFFPKVTSHPILTQAKEGNLSLRKRRRVID